MASRLPPSFRYVLALIVIGGAVIFGLGFGWYWSGSSMEQAVQTQINGPSCAGEAPCAPASEWPEYQLGSGYESVGELGMVAGAISAIGGIAAHQGLRELDAKANAGLPRPRDGLR